MHNIVERGDKLSDWLRIAEHVAARGAILVLDTLLVAFLIYRLLLLAKGTRAYQVLIGLLVFVLALYLSDALGLETIHWLLDRMTTLGPVALVILFFPELRRVLETIGRVEFWRSSLGVSSGTEPVQQAINEVVSAVQQMARDRIGALIVWERKDRIAQGNGIELQAEVTSPLLRTIFYPGSPLHDGAVILRGAEIVEAAVYFPEISQNPDIPSTMHTRHRAGIGVTENSDCVAVIVSEETGQITVAVDGAWTQNVDADHLRRLLSDLLTGEARPRILERMGMTLSGMRRQRTERKPNNRAEEKTA
ncbi:MAG: diadenylate cyclase CdaA [Fimbriimonadales bacterium]|nr:diadenylate cyclase CdaA [Fimbriimonadales bacterium]